MNPSCFPLYQWLFLIPLIGGRWYIITQLAGKIPLIYHLYSLPIGWLYISPIPSIKGTIETAARWLHFNQTNTVFRGKVENLSQHLGVSENSGTQQPWVFLPKMIILGCFGVPPFTETPIYVDKTYWNNKKTDLSHHCPWKNGRLFLPLFLVEAVLMGGSQEGHDTGYFYFNYYHCHWSFTMPCSYYSSNIFQRQKQKQSKVCFIPLAGFSMHFLRMTPITKKQVD